MPRRRSQGDGGIHWDASTQRYIAAVYLGPAPVGKARRPRITASAKIKTEAKDKLKLAQDRAALAAKDYTVEQAVNEWFDFGLHKREATTVKNLRSLANTHVIPALGAQKLQALSADEVDEWLADKAKGLSTDTLRRLHSILRRSIVRAQAREKVHRNVGDAVRDPDRHRRAPVEIALGAAGRCDLESRRILAPARLHRRVTADRRQDRRNAGLDLAEPRPGR